MRYIDIAKDLETQGYEHYRKLSKQCQVRELAGIFSFFMREEQKHYEIFDAWQKNGHFPEIVPTDGKQQSMELFRRLTDGITSMRVPAIDHDDADYKALILEKNSIAVYKEMVRETEDPELKKQLVIIIAQEEFHLHLVQSLMEFQRHPHEWLENAEWSHAEAY